jgi:S-formylglutathione hydrolase FrmB
MRRRCGKTFGDEQVMEHISLLDGPIPVLMDLAAVAACAAVVVALRRQWWRAAVALGIATLAAATYSWDVNLPRQFHGRFPDSFFVWAALPIAMLIVVVWSWGRFTWWPRVVAVAAVPLLIAVAAEQVNQFYGYVPTVGDLFGAPLPGEVSRLDQVMPHPSTGSIATAAADRPTSGVLLRTDFPAPISRFAHRSGYVWLPPAWFTRPRPKLPAIMLLEGSPGSPANWLRVVRAMDVANTWAKHHDGIAPLMVIPDSNGAFLADSECVDGSAGRAETYLTRDVVGWADHHFHVGQWAVAGLSEGGTCAVELALRHPRLFRVFADYSGDPFPNLGTEANTIRLLYHGNAAEWAAHDPRRLLARHRYPELRGWFAAGRSDSKKIPARMLAAAAGRAGVRVELSITPGNHNFYYWKRAFADSYAWLVDGLEPAART